MTATIENLRKARHAAHFVRLWRMLAASLAWRCTSTISVADRLERTCETDFPAGEVIPDLKARRERAWARTQRRAVIVDMRRRASLLAARAMRADERAGMAALESNLARLRGAALPLVSKAVEGLERIDWGYDDGNP
jgi:hypothetical protein